MLGDLLLAQIRIHANDAARTRAARLRKRMESLRGSFVGSSLLDFYMAKGADLAEVSVVPSVKLDQFFASLPNMPWQTFLESLAVPYVRFSRRLNTIRVVTSI